MVYIIVLLIYYHILIIIIIIKSQVMDFTRSRNLEEDITTDRYLIIMLEIENEEIE